MKALQTTNAAQQITQARPLQQSLINEFIAYIDRGEKTTRTYLTNLRQFIKWLEQTGTTAPTRESIILYRDYLAQQHKPNTVKQYLQSVRQFFAWAAAAGYYPNVAANIHAPKVRQDAHKKEALSAADVLTIEKSIEAGAKERTAAAAKAKKDTAGRIDRATEQGKRLFAMYQLMVTAGLRTIEISRANIKDIESRNGATFIYIYGKGHSEPDQKKPIAPQVYEAIKDYLNSRTDNPTGSSPLFVATGNRSGGKRIAPTTISTMIKRAMQQAGYNSEKITAHSLRHTAGNNIMELTGDNIFITQQYMRHESPKTTEIYLHRNTEEQEIDLAQRLYNKYHAQEQTDTREQISDLLEGMTAEQLNMLFYEAKEITK